MFCSTCQRKTKRLESTESGFGFERVFRDDKEAFEHFVGGTVPQYLQCILHLVAAGFDITSCDTSGASCVLQAAEYSLLGAMRISIISGADANICN
jgi:hypothetical protein